MTNIEQIFQVVAWALWYQRLDDFNVADPDELVNRYWKQWLLENAHEPAPVHMHCGCGIARQLCIYRTGTALTDFNHLLKHAFPDREIA